MNGRNHEFQFVEVQAKEYKEVKALKNEDIKQNKKNAFCISFLVRNCDFECDI